MSHVFLALGFTLAVVGGSMILSDHPVPGGILVALGSFLTGYFFCNLKFVAYAQWITRKVQEDDAVFAKVIRQLYDDDPVLANGAWKKAHPKVSPPWHKQPEGQGCD